MQRQHITTATETIQLCILNISKFYLLRSIRSRNQESVISDRASCIPVDDLKVLLTHNKTTSTREKLLKKSRNLPMNMVWENGKKKFLYCLPSFPRIQSRWINSENPLQKAHNTGEEYLINRQIINNKTARNVKCTASGCDDKKGRWRSRTKWKKQSKEEKESWRFKSSVV